MNSSEPCASMPPVESYASHRVKSQPVTERVTSVPLNEMAPPSPPERAPKKFELDTVTRASTAWIAPPCSSALT